MPGGVAGDVEDIPPRPYADPIRSEGPWGRWNIPLHSGALSKPTARLCVGIPMMVPRCTKGEDKPDVEQCMPGAGLSCLACREGPA